MLKTLAKKPTAGTPMPAESASIRPQKLLHDGNPAIARLELATNETPSDSQHIVAQDIWGSGNISPLDRLFSSTAIMKLVPKGSLGFIGPHLGRRLHRYSEDTGIWIDAFETDLTLSTLYKKKNTKIRLNEWTSDAALLKRNGNPFLIVAQASDLSISLETVYRQAANGLKPTGRLFVADLMRSTLDVCGAPQLPAIKGPAGQQLRSFSEHQTALATGNLAIEEQFDLTDALIAAVRSAFRDSVKVARELRALPESYRHQRYLAFYEQLQIWTILYALAQKRTITAVGLLAIKRS